VGLDDLGVVVAHRDAGARLERGVLAVARLAEDGAGRLAGVLVAGGDLELARAPEVPSDQALGAVHLERVVVLLPHRGPVGLADAERSGGHLEDGDDVVLVLDLAERESGLVDVEDRVAQHIPEFAAKGKEAVTLPRPGHADYAGTLKYGLADARDALERASARHTAVFVAAGSVAKALLRAIGIEVEGAVVDEEDLQGRVDEARAERDTVGGVVEVRGRGVPPGLGSYATKDDRLDARLAAALMGIQAVKGVEIGDGFALAALRGSQAHDELLPGLVRETNRAGGIEAGVSNGEEIVVRAAMKPLPTLMRPLRSVDLESGEPGEALVERSDVAAVEALAVVAEAAVALELARAARDKFGGDALEDFVASWRAYVERIPWDPR